MAARPYSLADELCETTDRLADAARACADSILSWAGSIRREGEGAGEELGGVAGGHGPGGREGAVDEHVAGGGGIKDSEMSHGAPRSRGLRERGNVMAVALYLVPTPLRVVAAGKFVSLGLLVNNAKYTFAGPGM